MLFLIILFSQSYGIKVGYGAGGSGQAAAKVGEEPKKAGGCC